MEKMQLVSREHINNFLKGDYMNIRRVAVVMLVGISALSFCYNASSYTSAMVTSPATICITTNDQALIGILGIHMDEPGFYLSVKNNMAKPITISNLSVSLQDSDKEVQKDLDIKIISKDIVKIPIDISEILDNSTPRKTQKGTIAIDSSWKGGEAKINYPFEVIWNGPVGIFEIDNFANGTKKLLQILKGINADVILGGGDTASAAINMGYKNSFKHISTGGGASLEMLEGKALLGVEIIDERNK